MLSVLTKIKKKEERGGIKGGIKWVVSCAVKAFTFWSSIHGKHNSINDYNKQNIYFPTLRVPQRS